MIGTSLRRGCEVEQRYGPSHYIISCRDCGQKNRVEAHRATQQTERVCGKCGGAVAGPISRETNDHGQVEVQFAKTQENRISTSVPAIIATNSKVGTQYKITIHADQDGAHISILANADGHSLATGLIQVSFNLEPEVVDEIQKVLNGDPGIVTTISLDPNQIV